MTTPARPTNRNSNSNRTRRRPVAPSSTTTAATTASAPATSVDMDMNYLHNMQPGPPMYSTDATMSVPTSQSDPYRSQAPLAPATAQSAMNMYQNGNSTDGQLARLPPRNSQLIRIPSFGGMSVPGMAQGIPAGMPTSAMNMNIMGPPSLLSQSHPYGPPPQEMIDRELYAQIEKIKKKRSSIPPFVMKLSSFVNDEKTDHLIRWTESGNSFQVLDEDEFSKTLIPDLFKHNNYASFVRQLNMYGFHKVVGLADGSLKTSEQRSKPPSEYENPYFKRGHPELLWLIQKPKSKKAARGSKKQAKEEQDSDKEDGMSDSGGVDGEVGGIYLEGPKDDHGGSTRSQRGRMDMSQLVDQIEAVRKHQAMISQAINRLRQDHQQLYEQSLAFQSLHDRHENSINAILTFLATVYDKSLGGHINGAVNNLFAHQVEQGQGIHRGPNATVSGNGTNGAIIPTATPGRPGHGVMRTPMNRRRPLLIEGGPSIDGLQALRGNGTADDDSQHSSSTLKSSGSPPLPPSYQTFPQTASIQELFTPSNTPDSPTNGNSPQQQHNEHLGSPTTPFSPIFSIPESPTTTSAPPTGPQLAPTPPMPHPITSSSPMQNVPRSLAKALRTPLSGSAQALQEHNASLAQKSQEIQDLEQLQAAQVENIEQLMGMMRDYTVTADGTTVDIDVPPNDVDQYFDFGVSGDGYSNGDDQPVDIDELLRGVTETAPKGTNPSTVAASPASSSVGSRAREEIEEEVEEVAPKRRKLV